MFLGSLLLYLSFSTTNCLYGVLVFIILNSMFTSLGSTSSRKMRGQIRGLDQVGKNAQDSISLIQTAEGALNETHDILQRMRELKSFRTHNQHPKHIF